MKKAIIIVVVILVLLIGAVVAIPIFFKQNLLDATKSTINKHINADVEFVDMNLSLIKNFPKVTLELEEVSIIGKNEFQNDTLLNLFSVKATMRLASLFNNAGIAIEKITLDKPQIKLVVNEAGKGNWEFIESDKTDNFVNIDTTDNTFRLHLNEVIIIDASFLYLDKQAKMEVGFSDINFDISGEVEGANTELVTEGKANNFNLSYNNIAYISNVTLETKTVFNIDYETMDISVGENEWLVNNLVLELSGDIKIPSDSMFFDLEIVTKKSDFENFLALVPPSYESYLKDIETSGTAAVKGSYKGYLFEDSYPNFLLNLDIADGIFHYTDFPEQIKNINADIVISKPQGELNLTQIKVNNAHAEIKNNPVDLTISVNNLIVDPWFDGAFVGKINFDHLKDVLPLDSVNIAGVIDANLFVKGYYSAIENEQYDNIKADGIVLLDNFIYDSPTLSQSVYIPKGKLNFSPKNINLSKLKMKVGQSDFNLSGKVSNYLNYFLKDGTLRGNLQLNSSFTNLNELLRLQVAENKTPEETNRELTADKPNENKETEVLAFDIPENINITFRSQIKRAVYDRLPITDINGLITARDGKLILNGLNMNMLDGEMNVTGSYKNTEQNQPFVDFGVDVISFDIPLTYQSLSGIRNMIPVAGQSKGKFSTKLNFKGILTPSHKFIPASINGGGQFSTKNLQINESQIFNQLRGIIKPEKLVNVTVDDFDANFEMEDGNIQLKPFITKVAGQETVFKGTLSAENLLNMRMDFNINRDAFGTDIQNILKIIPGNEKIKIVPAGVVLLGPVKNPEVKLDLSETRKTILDATKDDIKKTINNLGKTLNDIFKL